MSQSHIRSRLARFILYVACGIIAVHARADASVLRQGVSLPLQLRCWAFHVERWWDAQPSSCRSLP